MQFRTLVLLAALVAAVAAQGGNYGASSSSSTSNYGSSSSTSDYSSSSSSAPAYGDKGYKKKFAAPPFWVRWGHKLHAIKAKIAGGIKCLAHSFHQHWVNLKSDLERVAYWLKCEKTHFKHWWEYKCAVEKGKKKIRSALQQKYYDALCKLEKDQKSEYDRRVAECKDTKDEYTEEDDDYVQSTTTEEYKVEKVTKDYDDSSDTKKY
jgi:hypothetical protein